MSQQQKRVGFTLVELLVVIAIIAILVSLLLAAVQQAKSAANKAACSNNLHQIVIAFHLHQDALGFFPDGGGAYGNQSVTNGTPNTAPHQEWGWAYQILPYIEHDNEWMDTTGMAVQKQISLYRCPARSKRGPSGWGHGMSDYAANGGPETGPYNYDGGAVQMRGYYGDDGTWNEPSWADNWNTIVARGPVPPLSIENFPHSSTTLLVADAGKCGAVNGFCWNDEDGGYVGGFDFSMIAWGGNQPGRDLPFNFPISCELTQSHFRSAHSNSFNAAFVDGHIEPISYSIPLTTFQNFCKRLE